MIHSRNYSLTLFFLNQFKRSMICRLFFLQFLILLNFNQPQCLRTLQQFPVELIGHFDLIKLKIYICNAMDYLLATLISETRALIEIPLEACECIVESNWFEERLIECLTTHQRSCSLALVCLIEIILTRCRLFQALSIYEHIHRARSYFTFAIEI